MIAFLKGTLALRTPTAAYLDVNGVGFEVLMPQGSIAKLPGQGEEVSILTCMQVRDDGISLYGFLTAEEKALFEKLIGVSGIGPKVALSILSYFEPGQFAQAVSSQDVALISKVPGIGKKTAGRVVLELKGSLDAMQDTLFAPGGQLPSSAADVELAVEALLSMGFTQRECELALQDAPEGAKEAQLIQYALKHLGS